MVKKRKDKLPSGTGVEREVFLSKAFWALKGAAPQLLIYSLGKRQRRNVTDKKGVKGKDWINLDSITVTYKELENLFTDPVTGKKFGINQPRITRAIDHLLAKGFWEVKNPGGAYQQDKAVYGLIDKWKWWSRGTVFSRRERDVPRGFQDKDKKKEKGKKP